MMGMVLLFLTHLAIFIPAGKPAKTALVAATFLSAALEEAGGWLVRFVSPSLAPLKIIGFVGLQAAILFLLAALGVYLWRAAKAPEPAAPERKRTRRAAVALQGEPVRSASEDDDPPPVSAARGPER
jgi:hypothetical protein